MKTDVVYLFLSDSFVVDFVLFLFVRYSYARKLLWLCGRPLWASILHL